MARKKSDQTANTDTTNDATSGGGTMRKQIDPYIRLNVTDEQKARIACIEKRGVVVSTFLAQGGFLDDALSNIEKTFGIAAPVSYENGAAVTDDDADSMLPTI